MTTLGKLSDYWGVPFFFDPVGGLFNRLKNAVFVALGSALGLTGRSSGCSVHKEILRRCICYLPHCVTCACSNLQHVNVLALMTLNTTP